MGFRMIGRYTLRSACLTVVGAIWVSLLACPVSASDDPKESDARLLEAVKTFREGARVWRLDLLSKATSAFEARARMERRDARAAYWVAVGRFHLLLYHTSMAKGELPDERFDPLAERAGEAAEAALALDDKSAECHAMLMGVLGMRIQRLAIRGLWLGGSATGHRARAEGLGKDDPRAMYLVGASYLDGPERYGGAAKALDFLREARRLYAEEAKAERDALAPRWGRDHALVFLGRAYARLGKPREARACYEEALEANPESKLAKRELSE